MINKKINKKFFDKNTLEGKITYFLISLGLIFLLLIGPSLFILVFGSNYDKFPFLTKVLISFCINIIIIMILFFIYKKTLIKDFKNFFNNKFLDNVEVSFKYWLIGFIIMLISNLVLTYITKGGLSANEEAVRDLIDKVPLYMIFDVSLYAPFTEELIFRKSFKDFISNKWIYVIVSGLVFGGLHVISSVETPIDLLYIIPYSALGVSFAALYHKTDNIYSSMFMHCIHNTMAIVMYLFV